MIGETAWEQRVRLGHERQARFEADRLAILATRPSPIPEEKPIPLLRPIEEDKVRRHEHLPVSSRAYRRS